MNALIDEYIGLKTITSFISSSLDYYTSLGFHWFAISGALGVIVLLICRKQGKSKAILKGLLTFYVFLVLSYTLIGRPGLGYYAYDLRLFHTYEMAAYGYTGFLAERFLNICMLMPAGVLAYALWRKCVPVTLAGLGMSLFIETMQLVTQRGEYQVDDLFHNTLGVLIGCMVCKVVIGYIEKNR